MEGQHVSLDFRLLGRAGVSPTFDKGIGCGMLAGGRIKGESRLVTSYVITPGQADIYLLNAGVGYAGTRPTAA